MSQSVTPQWVRHVPHHRENWAQLSPGCSTHGQENVPTAQGGTRGVLEEDDGNRSEITSTENGFIIISRDCTATANPPSPNSTTARNGSIQMLMFFFVVF